jgi:hypothetical protein
MNEQIRREILKLPANVKNEVVQANRMIDKTRAKCELIRIANSNRLWGYHAEISRLIHEETKYIAKKANPSVIQKNLKL